MEGLPQDMVSLGTKKSAYRASVLGLSKCKFIGDVFNWTYVHGGTLRWFFEIIGTFRLSERRNAILNQAKKYHDFLQNLVERALGCTWQGQHIPTLIWKRRF